MLASRRATDDPPPARLLVERFGTSTRIAALTILLGAEVLFVLWFQSPHQTFVRFAAMDSGGELAIQSLLNQHLLPGVDFGYPYGLLALLAGRTWYGWAGLSPWAYQVYVAGLSLISAWGLARLAVACEITGVGLILVALAIPDLIFVTYLTSVQTLEQALLVNALAEQARGRRGRALAILTACCFVKPSLAFVQGLIVLIITMAATTSRSRSRRFGPLVPPCVTGLLLALWLATRFGPLALARTLSPATGAAIYRANHYGFFWGQGRAFWILPGAGLRDYFRYEVGFWLVGTAAILWGVASAARRRIRSRGTSAQGRDDELIITCGLVHLTFIALLFGHRWTWVYSLPMLIIGLALLGNRKMPARLVVAVLAVLLLINDRSKAVATLGLWRTEVASPATLGLWTAPREGDEWRHVRRLTAGQRPVIFAMCEGATILFPDFEPAVAGYLVPGNLRPSEVDRKARQLAAAPAIITYGSPGRSGFEFSSQLHAALDGCRQTFDGNFFQVYQRDSKPRRP